jgi:hypothetical protein
MPPDLRRQREAVRVADLARAGLGRDVHELVACRYDGDPGPPVDVDLRSAHRGHQPDGRRADDLARAQDHVAEPHVLAAAPHVLTLRDRALDGGRAAGASVEFELLGDLDHDDRIGALGHRRAGHDARRLAGPHCDGRVDARRDVLDHAEDRRRSLGGTRHVLGSHRVPVHRGVVERRDVDVGDDVRGQHAAERLERADALGGKRRDAREYVLLGFLDAQHVTVTPLSRDPGPPGLSAPCPDACI